MANQRDSSQQHEIDSNEAAVGSMTLQPPHPVSSAATSNQQVQSQPLGWEILCQSNVNQQPPPPAPTQQMNLQMHDLVQSQPAQPNCEFLRTNIYQHPPRAPAPAVQPPAQAVQEDPVALQNLMNLVLAYQSAYQRGPRGQQ